LEAGLAYKYAILKDCAALKIAKPVSVTSINSEQQSFVPGSPQYKVNW
jgi:hypothetical protein